MYLEDKRVKDQIDKLQKRIAKETNKTLDELEEILKTKASLKCLLTLYAALTKDNKEYEGLRLSTIAFLVDEGTPTVLKALDNLIKHKLVLLERKEAKYPRKEMTNFYRVTCRGIAVSVVLFGESFGDKVMEIKDALKE